MGLLGEILDTKLRATLFACLACAGLVGCSTDAGPDAPRVNGADLRKADAQMRQGQGPKAPSDAAGKQPGGAGPGGH